MIPSDTGPDRRPGPSGADTASARRHRPPPLVAAGVALCAAGVLAAGYWLFWSFVAGSLEDGIDAWAAERRAEGFRVAFGAVAIDGFPGWIRATMPRPEITRAGSRPWSWRGPDVVFRARPWRLSRFTLMAPGRHRVTGVVGGKPNKAVFQAGTLTAKIRLRGGGNGRARVTVRDLEVRDTDDALLGRLAAGAVAIRRPGAAPSHGSRSSLDLSADVDGLAVRLEPVPGLPRTTLAASLEASVKEGLPAGFGRAALADWRDGGGIVEIRVESFRHGALAIAGDGTLALDGAMQPIGAFTARVRGFDGLIDQLAATGRIEPRPAGMVKALLAAMAKTPADGGVPEVALSLSVQDRRFYVGPIPLARLPRLSWPGP